MKIFAHRGSHSATRPPNTLSAFEHAALLGFDGIETDVRTSAEGTAILFHDRCLRDGRPVSSLTHRELNTSVGYIVPTLAEALDQNQSMLWDLEIKTFAGFHAAMPILKTMRSTIEFIVSSFVHQLVLDATEYLDVCGGLLIAHAPSDPGSLGVGTARVHTLIWDFETVTEELVRQARARGFDSMIYGPISKAEHAAAERMGAEALITDSPQYSHAA